jgi:hypothetical protein
MYDINGIATISIFTEKAFYRIDDTLKKDYGDEIYNFHKNLGIYSIRFYEELLPLLAPFGNLRPKASEVLRTLGPLLGSTDEIFKDSTIIFKAFSALGVDVEKAVRVKNSPAFTVTSEMTDPINLVSSHKSNASNPTESIPPGWEKYKNNSGIPYYYHRATNKTQWIRPPMRPPGAPQFQNPVIMKKNPLQNITKLTQLASRNPLLKKRTRKNRKSN